MKIPAIAAMAVAAGSQSGARAPEPHPQMFAPDSAAFSDAALAALVQAQAGAASTLSDADAARIGADLAQRDPVLFRALDTSHSGTLTASELAAGRDKIAAAMRSGQLAPAQDAGDRPAPPAGPPPPGGKGGGGGPPAGGAPPPATGTSSAAAQIAELLAQEIIQLHRQGLSATEIAMRTGQTEKQVQQALSAG